MGLKKLQLLTQEWLD